MSDTGSIKDRKGPRKLKKWEEMYQELVEYHRIHGHVNIPLGDPNYAHLGVWVATQVRQRLVSDN